jgi:hypothetical protein
MSERPRGRYLSGCGIALLVVGLGLGLLDVLRPQPELTWAVALLSCFLGWSLAFWGLARRRLADASTASGIAACVLPFALFYAFGGWKDWSGVGLNCARPFYGALSIAWAAAIAIAGTVAGAQACARGEPRRGAIERVDWRRRVRPATAW